MKFKVGTRATGKSMVKLTSLTLAAALAVSLGGCLGYDGDVYRGYVINEKTMGQVKIGGSAEQTLVLLGTPSTTSTVGGDAWYYISQKVERPVAFMQQRVTDQRIFAVYFDKSKRVQRIANYGMEDGQIIDFITRTTPTAGAESSFLRNMMSNLLRFS